MRLGCAAYAGVFAAATIIVGGSYWALTDETHWLVGYEDSTRGFVPKFKLYWYEQMIVSMVTGAIFALPITAGVFVLHRGCQFIRRGRSADQ